MEAAAQKLSEMAVMNVTDETDEMVVTDEMIVTVVTGLTDELV